MNKVICDVCGSKYPETVEQCPICGCAKPENARVISDDSAGTDSKSTGTYTYVKGGRFSKSNVRKRNKVAVAAVPQNNPETSEIEEAPAGKSGKGLVIAIVALLLAIVAVMLFIFFRYFSPGTPVQDTSGSTQTTASSVTTLPEDTISLNIPCIGIELTSTSVSIEAIGNSWLLNVRVSPADTTDTVTYSTTNTDIVTVTDEGRITAVGTGEAIVSVSCGDQIVHCTVTVTDPSTTTEATTATTEPSTASDDWKLNKDDISFKTAGDSWNLLKGSVPADAITFTSDDPSIATIENGVVTAVAPGVTSVHAEYNGVEYSCIIRCRWEITTEDTTGDSAEDTESTESTAPAQANYTMYINGGKVKDNKGDVTITVKESFLLTLRNENGDVISVDWTMSKDGICTIDDNTVTGKNPGNVTVSVTYGGIEYSCIVRVKNK